LVLLPPGLTGPLTHTLRRSSATLQRMTSEHA
jgi:hypothetical protein